ncbi:ABC transporter substrate-binding protein [Halobacteriovorax sp. HLS]|uniref:substrate-binding periplasmic protein n=1 Tax=Halobacteriovorax sp. HLS TaxID=2234000 RepID=UPI000FD9B45C|nr:transporter substrate-binding domain-containing protein [Halobacteriovorax sp. HLS]
MKYIIYFALIVFQISASAEHLTAAIFDIPPWGSVDKKTGKIVGIQQEIIKIISSDLNLPIDVKLLPYKRMMNSLLVGESDFGVFYRNEERDEKLVPLVRWGELDIIVLPVKSVKITDYKSLSGLQVGVRLGGKFNDRFDADSKITKRSCINYSKCIERLKNGRIDAVIGTAATLYYEIEAQGLSVEQFGTPYFIGVKEDWLHFSKASKNKALMEKLKKSVEKNINNGKFGKAFSKYLPKKWKHQ